MKFFLGLVVVSLLAGHLADAGCLPFGLFAGKSAAQKLNDHLIDSVDSNDLARNIESAKTYLAEIKDKNLRDFTTKFIELEKVNAETLCADESLDTLDRLAYGLRKESASAFSEPEVRKRLNSLIAEIGSAQLKTCAQKFIDQYNKQVDEQKLEEEFKTLGYLPEGLRQGCTYSQLTKNQNLWLLRQRGIDIRGGGPTTRTAVEGALKRILREEGVSTLKKVDPKTGKLVKDWAHISQLVFSKLYQPCIAFIKLEEAKVLRRLLATLRIGNIETTDVSLFYYDHSDYTGNQNAIEWAMRLDTCERLLNSEQETVINMVYSRLLMGLNK